MIFSLFQSHPLFGLSQQSAHKILGKSAVFIPSLIIKGDLAFNNFFDSWGMVFRLKWGFSGNKLKNGDSKSPQVDPLIIASSNKDLRGLIERSSDDG